jgi:hypothetical protein
VLLRLTFRKKRPEDRWQIFRAWLWKDLTRRLQRVPSDDELIAEITEWRGQQYYATTNLMAWMDTLRMDFLPDYRKANRIKKAKRASEKRWKKNKKLD